MPHWREKVRLSLLRFFARLSGPFVPSGKTPPRIGARVLMVRPDHLGDLLFTTPALREFREQHPDAHVTLLVGPWSLPVAEGCPYVDAVEVCSFPGFSRGCKGRVWQPYALLFRECRRLRDGHFDQAIILRFDHWWGALLTYTAGIPCRVGYGVRECEPFLTRVVPYVRGRHEVLQNLVLMRAAECREPMVKAELPAVEPSGTPLEFAPSEAAVTQVRTMLEADGVGSTVMLVCLHPGAGALVKRWRPEGFAEVGDALASQYGARVVITGSAGEVGLGEEIASLMRESPLLLAGRTNLDQLSALLARCSLVVGPDSGPLHLAVAVGTPSVHLYGPGDPMIFGPWGDAERHLVVTSEMDCVPCGRLDYAPAELWEHPCVRRISTDQVLEACRRLLAKPVSG